jgi:hypothetical protein
MDRLPTTMEMAKDLLRGAFGLAVLFGLAYLGEWLGIGPIAGVIIIGVGAALIAGTIKWVIMKKQGRA